MWLHLFFVYFCVRRCHNVNKIRRSPWDCVKNLNIKSLEKKMHIDIQVHYTMLQCTVYSTLPWNAKYTYLVFVCFLFAFNLGLGSCRSYVTLCSQNCTCACQPYFVIFWGYSPPPPPIFNKYMVSYFKRIHILIKWQRKE